VFALFENLVRLKDEKKTKTTRESFMALLAYLRIYLLRNNVAFIHRLNPIPEGERYEGQTPKAHPEECLSVPNIFSIDYY
jgi:hypothetical protein